MRTATPSGRVSTELGNPPGRQPGWSQHLVPVGPPPTVAGVPLTEVASEVTARGVRAPVPAADPTPGVAVVGFPNLGSPLATAGGQPNIPWTQFLANLWRFVQPTGIIPGTYAGIIFNAYGQAISASSSGAIFENPSLNNPTFTGTVTAPTPPANDNSDTVATTAWVREQNYATEAFVGAQGFATEDYVNSQGFATETWVREQGYITDAPADGQFYARQNGAWVAIVATPVP